MEFTPRLQTAQDLSESKDDILSLANIPTDFNWNAEHSVLTPIHRTLQAEPTPQQAAQTELLSECLRDGLHGVTRYPSVEDLLRYTKVLCDFGVSDLMVGVYPGEKNTVNNDIRTLLAYIRDNVPSIIPTVLCPCTSGSLRWAAECKNIHPKLEACIFMGSAPFRRFVQNWDLDFILQQFSHYIAEAVRLGIPVMGGTEHTTQTPPADLCQIVRVQVEQGAYRFVIADTIGIARPKGAFRIVHFVKNFLKKIGAQHVKIDWHGHQDTGNAVANSLTALAAGANRIHVVSRGIGERAGNTPLEDLVLNLTTILEEAGRVSPWKMSQLLNLISLYENIVDVAMPEHGPLGKRYNHTSLGIHTDAILKANRLADTALQAEDYETEYRLRKMMRTIYSAVDPQAIGGNVSVGVSQWSSRSSVQLAYFFSGGNIEELSPEVVDQVFIKAKELGRELEHSELEQLFSK